MRNELIFILHLLTGYAEQYFEKLSDEELSRMYDEQMEKGLSESAV